MSAKNERGSMTAGDLTMTDFSTLLDAVDTLAATGAITLEDKAVLKHKLTTLCSDMLVEAGDAIASAPHGGAGAARAKRKAIGPGVSKPTDQPMPEFEPPTPEHVKVEKSDSKLTPERRGRLQEIARQLEQLSSEDTEA